MGLDGQMSLRLAVVSLALAVSSCTLGLRVHRSTNEEVVRERLGETHSLLVERRQDDVWVSACLAERVRLRTYAVETVQRQRTKWSEDIGPMVVFVDVFAGPLSDLMLGIAAPFRRDWDVAWGPVGVLVAMIIPGITSGPGGEGAPLGSDKYLEIALWDTTSHRNETGFRDFDDAARGVRTVLRVVTDQEVFDVHTDSNGEAVVPLDRLFGPTRSPGRITIAWGENLFRVEFDGTLVSSTSMAAKTK